MLNNRVDFIGDLYVLLSISIFKNSFFLQRSFLIKTLQVEVVAGLEDLGGETGSSLMSELSFFGNLDDRSSLSWRWCCCCCCCCCAVNLAFKNSSSSLLERLRNMFEDEDEMGCCMTSRGWCTLTTSRLLSNGGQYRHTARNPSRTPLTHLHSRSQMQGFTL